MAKVGDIEIKLKVETNKFNSDMKRSEQAAKKFSKNTENNIKKMSTSVKGSLASVATSAKTAVKAFAALSAVSYAKGIVTDVTAAAKETLAWSNTLKIGTTELQAFGLAASQVGFSSEKVADIFKDVSDKLGDFIATGGGEAKDVFERLGLTIDDLKGKAPDKAIQLIVDQMDKLNGTAKELNQQEKIFLLESVANDASKLIPLLENGGKKLNEFKKIAEKSGAIIKPSDLKAIEEFRLESKKLSLQWEGIKTQLAVTLMPVMQALAKITRTMVDGLMLIPKLIGKIGSGIGGLAGRIGSKFEGLKGMDTNILAPTNLKPISAPANTQDSIDNIMKGLLKDRAASDAAKVQKEAAEKQVQAAASQQKAAESVKLRSETAIGQILGSRGKGETSRILGEGPKQAQSDNFDRIFRDLVQSIQSGDSTKRSQQYGIDMLKQIAGSHKMFGAAGSTLGMENAIKDLQNFISGKKDDEIKVNISVDVKPSDKFDTELETKIERINGNSFGDAAAAIGQ